MNFFCVETGLQYHLRMLVLKSPKGAAIRCEWGNRSVVVFPEKQEKADALVTLFRTPEEAPQKGTISWPGEYDIQDVTIRGIGHNEGAQISYVVELDSVRCGFLSSPLQEWSDYELELLGDIDVLVVPTDDPKRVQKLVDEIDPRVLIPVSNGDESAYAEVLGVCGARGKEAVPEYKVKVLPVEGREIVVLKRG
ncbi:MAG: hypothetical protein UY85_C0031G0002 [Candidatus Peribacteria bacterium GW2011_GWB1_54_5]|nr:MAG: hypothetical protein UY85_C0031G0002 [Candidatus Peribacteria bacterium GW2011_GWB1_54_5]KKW40360.1 MAG: hypothetical protein UY87_C0024G0005 [Candidatus Peribacteria bacterium GW2011_GWC2_54_8]KKW44521.1 MAG: hypothetical protein UY90_C0008G0007 [Candidatus Peregrinibacteria bacterium GW2011_GWA2_54_9]PIR49563.1 MAG: hypothetical protein COU79_04185 [Candidatus Peregrinibacteria bacterium CG10_big_fil_rev_8_21_14_0_10_54_7]